jgi:hypothetical protein
MTVVHTAMGGEKPYAGELLDTCKLFGYKDVGDGNMGNDKAIEAYVERKAATRRSILEKASMGGIQHRLSQSVRGQTELG